MAPVQRKKTRLAHSCTQCARRKVRCSKIIPCSSCMDRGLASQCQVHPRSGLLNTGRSRVSEDLAVTPRNSVSSVAGSVTRPPPARAYSAADRASSPLALVQDQTRQFSPGGSRPIASSRLDSAQMVNRSAGSLVNSASLSASSEMITLASAPIKTCNLANDSAVTLEFLALGRRNIFGSRKCTASERPTFTPNIAADLVNGPTAAFPEHWDAILSHDEARQALDLHEQSFVWYHNVVHLPAFRQEFESNLTKAAPDLNWLALYYAILCTTFHHFSETDFNRLGISLIDRRESTRSLFNRSIESMNQGNFMSRHSLASIQTICILLQVAHNIDQSDFITVMLAAAIRIGQCLGIHRLGPDRRAATEGMDPDLARQYLVEREVKKRVWWFLVRQDWLQIPFQNTHLIYANQFNTPMPSNCYDDEERMTYGGEVISQDESVLTQNSYTQHLNRVAVVILKHQDRMLAAGHPLASEHGITKLYDQVILADKQLKDAYHALPAFLKDDSILNSGDTSYPDHLRFQGSIVFLSYAHKTLTIHRHFQVECFRDHRFCFTQMSCLAIAERSITLLKSWQENPGSELARKLWTVVTHTITCCVFLIFASIFRARNALLYDAERMRQLAVVGRQIVARMESNSSIARRGGRVLDLLLECDARGQSSSGTSLSIEDIVRDIAEMVNEDVDPTCSRSQFHLPSTLDWWTESLAAV